MEEELEAALYEQALAERLVAALAILDVHTALALLDAWPDLTSAS